jgi:hypothetical protein
MRSAFEDFVARPRHRVVGGDDLVAAEIGRATGADVVGTGRERLPDRSTSIWPAARCRSSCGPGRHRPRPAGRAGPRAPQRQERSGGGSGRPGRGVPFDAAARALARFAGVARRFEFRGSEAGVTFVDDYAHLPSEVRPPWPRPATATGGRVVAVFQPHRYSRTAELWASSAPSFGDADLVVVTDVYGAGEAPVPGVSGQLVADAVRRSAPGSRCLRGRPVGPPHGRSARSWSRGPVLHPRSRRPHFAPGRAAVRTGVGERGMTTTPGDLDARRAGPRTPGPPPPSARCPDHLSGGR